MTTTNVHRRDLWILTLLAAALFLPGLGLRDVWNPDEARYGQVAREMADHGSLFVPRLNGEIYTQKPPVFFWAIELSGLITGGIGETAVRLPSALAALGSILLVFSMARRMFNRRAAWLAAAAFGSCFKILWQGRFGQIDMLLTFWVTLAVWLWLRGWLEERPGFYTLFWVVTGVATVTKGPVGLLPPLLSILTFLWLRGERRALKRLHVGRGLLIWATVVAAWLIPAGWVAGSEYLEQMVFKQNITRYADPWHHHQPFYYYLTVLPADFFPWSLWLPAAAVVSWRRLRNRKEKREEPQGQHGERAAGDRSSHSDDGLLLALCWIGVTLLFFSLSPAKRTVYILTLYPALGLWVGAALDRLTATWPRHRGWLLWPLGLLIALLVAAIAVLAVEGPKRPEIEILGQGFLWITVSAAGVLLAGAVASLALAWRGRLPRATAALAVGMAGMWLTVALMVLPALDVFKSARGLATELARYVGPGEPWTVFPRLDAGFLFYSDLRAHRLEGEGSEEMEVRSLRRFVARAERVWVLARRDVLEGIEDLPPLHEAARDRDPDKGYLLLTNRPLSRFSQEKQLDK